MQAKTALAILSDQPRSGSEERIGNLAEVRIGDKDNELALARTVQRTEGTDLDQAESCGERLVDPTARVVKRRVWTVDRDAGTEQRGQHAALRRVARQALDSTEQDRVMGDDQLRFCLNCLGGALGRDSQTGEHAAHLGAAFAEQQPDVVPFGSEGGWGEPLQVIDDSGDGVHGGWVVRWCRGLVVGWRGGTEPIMSRTNYATTSPPNSRAFYRRGIAKRAGPAKILRQEGEECNSGATSCPLHSGPASMGSRTGRRPAAKI